MTSLSVVKPSPTCRFAAPRFLDFVRIASQRTNDRVSLIRVFQILSESRIGETAKSVVSLIRKVAESLPCHQKHPIVSSLCWRPTCSTSNALWFLKGKGIPCLTKAHLSGFVTLNILLGSYLRLLTTFLTVRGWAAAQQMTPLPKTRCSWNNFRLLRYFMRRITESISTRLNF